MVCLMKNVTKSCPIICEEKLLPLDISLYSTETRSNPKPLEKFEGQTALKGWVK